MQKLIFLLTLSLISSVLLIKQLKLNFYKTMAYVVEESAPDQAETYYRIAYNESCRDLQFILRYAKLLEASSKSVEAIRVLDECHKQIASIDLEITLGDLLVSKDNNTLALEHYVHAHTMSPSKLVPLYSIAKVFVNSGQFSKADSIIHIINKKASTSNPDLFAIKEELNSARRNWQIDTIHTAPK